jgi:hypothetical protein
MSSFYRVMFCTTFALLVLAISMPQAIAGVKSVFAENHKVAEHSRNFYNGKKGKYNDIDVHRVTYNDGSTCVIATAESNMDHPASLQMQCSFPDGPAPPQ